MADAFATERRKLGPGTIVADKYRLERVLGRGGMGMVIEARHVQLGTSFALKFLHRSILGNTSVTERFLREARATAALRSEHVCRVFDVGSFEGAPFLVMELLEGTDLERVLHREKRLLPQVACNYLIQACAGVSEAHAARIVHRDLKPGNLFLVTRADGGSIVKVLDFGIAKAPQTTELGLTGTDHILGSPAYMSLEQLRSSRLVDTRSDIWSLGVILYELLAGRRPFHGEGVADLALRIAMESFARLPEDVAPAHVREPLDAIIARCLEREPAQRYQSVAELALALAPFADAPERRIASSLSRHSRPPSFPSFPPEVIAGAGGTTTAYAAYEEQRPDGATTLHTSGAIENPPRTRRSRARAAVIVLAASLVGGVALGLATLGGGSSAGAPAPDRAAQPGDVGAAAAAPVATAPRALATELAAPAPQLAPVSPGPLPPVSTITLRFAIEPPVAAVELDGVFVTSRQITVRRDDAPHRLRISAPGFVAQEREVRLDDSQQLVIQLARARRAPPPAPVQPKRLESHSPYE